MADGAYIDIQLIVSTPSVAIPNPDPLEERASSVAFVVSWNSRTGAVLPAVGDYAASQVTNNSGVTGTFVSDALDYLASQGGVSVHNDLTSIQGGEVAGYFHFTETQHTRLSPITAFGATLIAAADAPTALGILGAVGGRARPRSVVMVPQRTHSYTPRGQWNYWP